ncbi:acyl-coenzyme A thioesterase THEM4 [Corynascus novoguineensis]|uniref:Acyl-coenzyme A thioesterase THEM4 n=1 Tax=Corynascus novoguineensis TaxID=1126955 RepID=A0AAN7CK40_9PEZI|nr:acyl-coenzyme A thioesterase THEM4 [Corynascus novoguineensis]
MTPLSAAQQIDFFRAIPWCAAHLASPSLVINESVSHRSKRRDLDRLISRTLNRPDGIPAYIIFYDAPSPSSPTPPSSAASTPSPLSAPLDSSRSTSAQNNQPTAANEQPRPFINQVSALVALGPGLNGWEGICHGGMVVTLLDEVMGQLLAANRSEGLLPADVPSMTAYLNTRFERPVRTDTALSSSGGQQKNDSATTVVLVEARLRRHEGRKYWLEADVRGSEGEVLARAEALFVMLKAKL